MLPAESKFSFDPSAMDGRNTIVGEEHDLTGNSNRIIVPVYTPFYSQGVVVARDSGIPLVLGRDYQFVYLYQRATIETGHEVVTAISLINPTITEDTIRLSYQTVGGEFEGESVAIHEVVKNLEQVDLTVHWDDIRNKPAVFPPGPHKHNAQDLVGLSALVQAVHGISEAIDINNNELLADIQDQLDGKLTAFGRTKLITEDADIKIDSYTGAVELQFGRSADQNAFFSMDFIIVSAEGTAKFTVTAKEMELGMELQHYAGTGLGGERIQMDMLTRGNNTNSLFIQLADPEAQWENVYLAVLAITASTDDPDDYTGPWNWVLDPDLTDVVFRDPDTEIGTVVTALQENRDAVLQLTDIVDTHIHNRENPHGVTQEQVGTEVVEQLIDQETEDILAIVRETLSREVSF